MVKNGKVVYIVMLYVGNYQTEVLGVVKTKAEAEKYMRAHKNTYYIERVLGNL